MKKIIYIAIIFSNIFFLKGFSQNNKGILTSEYWELSADHTGENDTYIARDYIKLKYGFKHTAEPGKSFIGKINPSLIFGTPYSNAQTPFSTNLPVGSLPGSVNVSPTGAATYNIPIALPPGTAGMMPGLSIVYNSQSGDGMLGKGWTIAGFSTITRIPATLYHDGFVGGVNFDGNDRFVLDGQRLIATNGTYGDDCTEYHTENEIFSKIVSFFHSGSGNGPALFEVETKAGNTLQYIYPGNAKAKDPGDDDVMYWLLNKVSDPLGNYYTITYREYKGMYYPLVIDYTFNSGFNSYNKVKFLYTERNDPSILYIAGTAYKNSLIMSDIKIYNNNYLIRKYTFKYNFNSFSRLSEIQLYEDRNKTINTTKIEWGNETNSSTSSTIHLIGGNNYQGEYDYYPGDYNGDGKTDLFVTLKKKDEEGTLQYDRRWNIIYEKWQYYTVDNNGDFHLQQEGFLNRHIKCYPGDYNGDGKTDILKVTFNDGNNTHYDAILISNGNQFEHLITYESYGAYERKYNFGDFNGDGKTDWIVLTKEDNYSKYKIFITSDDWSHHLLLIENNTSNGDFIEKLYVVDFNGNGKSDIMFIYDRWDEYACRILEFEEVEFGQDYMKQIYNGGFPTKNHRIYNGDFNGDGKTDIMTWTSYQNIGWKIHLSTGNSYAWSGNPDCNFDHNNDPEQSYSNDNYIVADYNGDGKADVLEQYLLSGNNSRFNIFYSQGNSFHKEPNNIPNVYPYLYHFFVNADFNGDGKQDCLLNTGYFEYDRKIIYFHPYEQKHLVKSITNGYNNKTQFEYKPITSSDVYTKGTGANYPVIDFQGALYVVKNLIVPNGYSTSTTIQNYKYERAKIHKQGKGFLGFMKIISINSRTRIGTETKFTYNTSYFNSYPLYSKKFYNQHSSSTYTYISSSTVLNQITQHLGNKRIFTYPKETENTNHLTNTTVSSNVTYDSNGNLTRSYVNYDDEGNTETLYQDYITAGAWLPTKPEKTIIKKTATGKPLYTRTSEFEYFGNGLLKKSIADPDDAINKITTEYLYNSFGNAINTSISAPGEETRNASFGYDSKNRFVLNQTDPLNFTSSKTYDEETGNILTQTDINGHITKFKYDAFGSLIETELPDGTKAYQTTKWYTDTEISNALTYVITNAEGEAPVTTYYDILGRKIRTKSSGFKNETIISIIHYDDNGQVYKTFEPHFKGETVNYTGFGFDNYGRQLCIIAPTGTVNYTYDEDNPKVTRIDFPDNTFKTSTINSLGQVIKAEDNGGEINYDYNSAGLPQTITAPGGAVVVIGYDNYGNKKTLTDPDAGTILYEYDAFSNITKQTDANGNIHDMEYDIAGRIIKKSGTEGITDYVYDTAPNALGMLAGEIMTPNLLKGGLSPLSGDLGVKSEANSKTYTYDNLSRLSSVTETFENEDYTYSYNYDNLGRINRMTYPSGFAYTKHYKSNGYLEQIKRADNSGLIWKPIEMNALGQIKVLEKGNGLTTDKTYDNYHRPETVVTGTIQDIEYNFETTTANLLSRIDHIHSNTESFTYDDNRLHTIKQNSTTVNTINYDNPTGNIENKTDAGTYTYDPNKIHSVKHVTGNTYIPSQNQDINYTPFNKVIQITEGNFHIDFTYGLSNQRKKTELKEQDVLIKTKYFFGSYEKTIDNLTGEVTEYNFLPGGAIFKVKNGAEKMLYTYTDHLGSITHITDATGYLLAEQSFDAWGRMRDPETWEIINNQSSIINGRGYTGHEMLPQFGLINMNGRLYDPILGRMLSPDNYIQAPDFTQNFNRYSYAYNNPLKFNDPDGEWVQMVIGGILGGYSGYQIGNAMGATGWSMAGYIVGGAVIGAVSGGIASEIAASGGFMANTASMVAGSYINSTGMAALSGGMTDVNVGFGAGSYNITQNEWGYIGKSGNTFMQNVGYGFGAFANASDIYAGFNGINITSTTKYKKMGHNDIIGGEYNKIEDSYEIEISVGPGDQGSGKNWVFQKNNYANTKWGHVDSKKS